MCPESQTWVSGFGFRDTLTLKGWRGVDAFEVKVYKNSPGATANPLEPLHAEPAAALVGLELLA